MYEAGSAAVLLGFRVNRTGLLDYMKDVATVKKEKGHEYLLTAKDEASGTLAKFRNAVLGTRDATLSLTASVDESMANVGAAVDKATVRADAGLGKMSESAGKTSSAILGVGDSFKSMAAIVTDETAKADAGVRRMAEEHKAAADSVVRDNARIAESTSAAVGGAAGGGGGRSIVTPVGGGGAGETPERQVTKATDSWKKGFGTMATLGKWATVAFLGIGAVSVKWAADFQRQMEMIHTQAGASQHEVDALRKGVLALAPAVGIGPTKLAEGLFHAESAGFRGAKAMDVLKLAAEGAKVGGADLEEVMNALVGIMNTAPKDIHSVSEAMGVMNDIVGQGNLRMSELTGAIGTGLVAAGKAVGLGLRDVGAALDVMTTRGIPAQEGATRLRTVLGLIANPTQKAQKALDELGFTHHQLAEDFRKKGLIGALEDLQTHMQRVFGHKLDDAQIRSALTAYAQRLKDAGASTDTIRKDLIKYRQELVNSGDGAVKASGLIADAFGGARMGTTMQILMQNIGSVRDHLTALHKDNAAGRFQKDWQATQKDFSVQASQLGASIQKIGIGLGDYLIPKVKALVNALIEAGKWLGHHKVLAEALAVAFGTLLTAAIAAFFARFIKRTADGILSIGKFGKAIYDLPKTIEAATKKYVASKTREIEIEKEHQTALEELQAQAESTGAALDGMGGAEAAGGVVREGGGGVEGALSGAVEGMITGIRGIMAPGSLENPLAVMIVEGMVPGGTAPLNETPAGVREPLAAEEAAVIRSEGELPLGGAGTPLPARLRAQVDARRARLGGVSESQAMLTAETAAPEAAMMTETSVMGRVGGVAGKFGSRLMGGLGMAGMGVMGAQLAGSVIGGQAGHTVSTVGSLAAGGAGLGSMIAPGIGTALGGALGAAAGIAISLLGHNKSYGQKIADSLTSGFGGAASDSLKKQLAKTLDEADKFASKSHLTFGGMLIPGIDSKDKQKLLKDYEAAGLLVAHQLEKGWNEFKFQDEPTMFKQFKAEVDSLPPYAQYAAAESAIRFAHKLEEEGRLPKGATKTLLRQIREEFPGFQSFMGQQGDLTWKNFTRTESAKQVEKFVQTHLNNLASEFAQLPPKIKADGGDMQSQWATTWSVILSETHNSSSKVREAALSALKTMVKDTQTILPHIGEIMDTESATGRQKLISNLSSAMDGVRVLMRHGVIHTSDGMKIINKLLSGELKALAVNVAAPIAQSINTGAFDPNKWFAGSTLGNSGSGGAIGSSTNTLAMKETGGVLPGSEFGLRDMMTLVDPQGRPRAKMAGDESIFTRHQMPFVEAGLQMLGFSGASELWQKVNVPHSNGYEKGGKLPAFATGGYMYPLPSNAIVGRTDMGVDADMRPGQPIGPIGDARIMGVLSNWFQGQPLLWWKLLNGPRAGRYAYVAEQIANLARPGQLVRANQAVATYATSGTGIEYGWATATGETLAQATTGYTEGQVTPAGQDMARFLTGLAHGKILGGGAIGNMAGWSDLHTPKSGMQGPMGAIVSGVLKMATKAANRYGARKASNANLAAQFAGQGGGNAANEALGKRMMLAAGWPISQWPALKALWIQESGWDANIVNPSSGAYGIPQSLGHGHPYNLGDAPAQIAWGLNYIRQRYKTPDAAEAHERANNWYQRGGSLPGFQSGGNPWASLFGGTSFLPGFRPIRTRRSGSGLHTVGGRGTAGSRRGLRTSGRSASPSGRSKTASRHRQPLSQSTAAVLQSIGLGSFVDDQNSLGQLDNQYTQQANLFQMFDGSTLNQGDLDALMGIREQQWDILSTEWKQLPAALTRLQTNVTELQGSPGRRAHPAEWTWVPGGGGFGGGHLARVPAQTGIRRTQGVTGLTKEIAGLENEITGLKAQTVADTRHMATIRHAATGRAMALADSLAQSEAQYITDQSAIADQKTILTQTRIQLQRQRNSLANTKAGPPSVEDLVSQVMSGVTTPPDANAGVKGQRKAIESQLLDLRSQDSALSTASRHLSNQHKQQRAQISVAEKQLRAEGWAEAWAIQLSKWKVQDKITKLQDKIKKLKALLKLESDQLKSEQSALSQIQSWETGGLQGNQSILQSLGDIGFDILGLWQQGAHLPTQGRSGPTLQAVENLLSAKPPNGLGLILPPGLAGGASAAAAAASQVATAFGMFQDFQASRAALFSQFGSNFVPGGRMPFGTPTAAAAGVQYYGAAAGPGAGSATGSLDRSSFAGGGWLGGGGSKGDTRIDITNHFGGGPPDPQTWASGVNHELSAMV